ncbi:tetratricopeptide repeat protein [Tenacibaculum halocynthiae]|uniref:tetratricopeptide repeat protein n=1 Tax=Tenacibaculum halocynthiae TaxID=1254437 RepID=UPI003D65080E
MLKYKSKFATKKSEAHLLLKRGAAYFNKEMLEQASQDYDTSADLFLLSGDSIFAADARFFAGQVYTDLKNFITSVERFKQAYKIYDRLGDKDYSNYTLNELSSLYGRNGFYDKAIYERKRVLSNAKKLKNYIAMTFAYVHLASGYFDKKEYDTYKKYNDSIALNLDSIKNKYNHAEFSFQLSKMNLEYSLKTDNLEKANFFLKETKNKIKFGKLETYYEKPILYLEALLNFKNKKFNKAKKGLEKLLNKKNKGPVKIIMRAEKKLADIYEQEKKYAKAFYHLSNYLNLKNEYDTQIKTNTFLYYQSEFETERKDNEIYKKETEISLLEKDKEIAKSKRKVMLMLLISIFLLSIVISFYIWKQGKEKSKKLSLKIDKNKKELKEFTD